MSELKRKAIHISGIVTIPLDLYFGLSIPIILLLVLSSLYTISEYMRNKGDSIPIMQTIINTTTRGTSDGTTDYSPLLLSAGVLVSLLLYPNPINYCAIIAVILGDGFASLVGRRYGRHKLIFNKSLEGTATGLIATFIGCLFFVSPEIALCTAVVAMAIEILPLGKFDNIVIPVLVGLFLGFIVIPVMFGLSL